MGRRRRRSSSIRVLLKPLFEKSSFTEVDTCTVLDRSTVLEAATKSRSKIYGRCGNNRQNS